MGTGAGFEKIQSRRAVKIYPAGYGSSSGNLLQKNHPLKVSYHDEHVLRLQSFIKKHIE